MDHYEVVIYPLNTHRGVNGSKAKVKATKSHYFQAVNVLQLAIINVVR